MKQANNTEIDRLLQRHARRFGTAAASGEGDGRDQVAAHNAGAHLDADEMNAYAEGALPAAARSRYASHLADCDSCRAVVTNLTLAAQPAVQESRGDLTENASPSKSWWSAIAALFAPPVLRYAVPAVLLFGVIVVALVATRNRSESQFVARNEEKQTDGAVTKQAEPVPSPAQVGEATGAANTSANRPVTTEANANDQAQLADGTLRSNANAGQPASAAPPPPAPISDAKEAAKREESAVNDERYANEPEPTPARARPSSTVAGKVEEQKRDQQQDTVATTGAATENTELGRSSSGKDAEAKNSPPNAGDLASQQTAPSQAGSRANTRRAAKSAAARSAEDNDRADSSNETRSVGGRRFRRQGNAWIDTAYNSSRSTINVARGSDQYRALAADEPGLRSIAEQLGGEVIVVWKGKAYRIH